MKLKLTEEMNLELISIGTQIATLTEVCGYEARDMKRIYKDELESYKIKLENFYSDTDLKE